MNIEYSSLKKFIAIFLAVAECVIIIISGLLVDKINKEMISKVYSIIFNFSGIFFTVMGIWVALLYPKIKDNTYTGKDKKVFKKVIYSLIATSLSLVVCLICLTMINLPLTSLISYDLIKYFKIIIVGGGVFLVFIQIYFLIQSLSPIFHVDNELNQSEVEKMKAHPGGFEAKPGEE